MSMYDPDEHTDRAHRAILRGIDPAALPVVRWPYEGHPCALWAVEVLEPGREFGSGELLRVDCGPSVFGGRATTDATYHRQADAVAACLRHRRERPDLIAQVVPFVP